MPEKEGGREGRKDERLLLALLCGLHVWNILFLPSFLLSLPPSLQAASSRYMGKLVAQLIVSVHMGEKRYQSCPPSLPPSLPPLLTSGQQQVHGEVDGPVNGVYVREEGQEVGGRVRGPDLFVKGVGFLVLHRE